jgi:hypothetical protein
MMQTRTAQPVFCSIAVSRNDLLDAIICAAWLCWLQHNCFLLKHFSEAVPLTRHWNPSEIAAMDSRHGLKAYPVPIESEPDFSCLF